MMASPPSWRMATSNDTRVRVEGRSKIIASVLPASGRSASGPGFRRPSWRARPRRSCASPRPACRSDRESGGRAHWAASSAAPWRATRLSRAQARSSRVIASAISALADDQRRQQPHDIVAGRDGDHFLGAQRIDQFAGRNHGAKTDQQSFAAHFGDQRRIAVLDLGEPLLQQQPDAPHAARKSRVPA